MPRLPELLRPIADSELPHLARHKQRGAFAIASTLVIVQAVFDVITLLCGDAALAHLLVSEGVNIVVCGGTIVAVKRPWGRRWVDTLLLALALLLLFDLADTGWTMKEGRNDLLVFAPIVPLVMGSFVPWKPSHAFALLPPTLACIYLVPGHNDAFSGSQTSVVFATVSMTVASAIASQLQRHLWRRLERANAQLAAADRMSTLGRMTAGIAHELKTPLAAVMNGLESIHSLSTELNDSVGHPDVTNADLHEIVSEIRDVVRTSESGARRAAQFVSSIREQTLQMTSMQREPFSVRDVVVSAVTLLEHVRRRTGASIDATKLDADLRVIGDRGKLGQIVTNLVHNALDACKDTPKGKIQISATGAGDTITLVVEDDGPGIAPVHRARIFDALFTTKGAEEGTGLGLAISRDLAEGAFGGTLKLADSPRGARFELCIPCEAARVSTASGAWAPARAA